MESCNFKLYFGQNPSNNLVSTQDAVDLGNPKAHGKEAKLQWHFIIPAGIIFFNLLFLITYRSRTMNTTLSENPRNCKCLERGRSISTFHFGVNALSYCNLLLSWLAIIAISRRHHSSKIYLMVRLHVSVSALQ